MSLAPATFPDDALSRATSSPHAKTAPAVDILPGSGRQSLHSFPVLPLPRLDIARPRVLYLHSVVDLGRSLVGHRSSSKSPASLPLCVSHPHSGSEESRDVRILSREFRISSREIGAP